MAFWQWWSGWFVILICTFTTLKILPCPPMFIWMTFVQLQYPAGLLSSQRWGGTAAKKQDIQNHASPAFYMLSYKLLMYPVCLSTPQRCPFFPCLHPKHSTFSLPLHWFTSSFTGSVTFCGDNVQFFYPSHNFTLPEVHEHNREWDIRRNT